MRPSVGFHVPLIIDIPSTGHYVLSGTMDTILGCHLTLIDHYLSARLHDFSVAANFSLGYHIHSMVPRPSLGLPILRLP